MADDTEVKQLLSAISVLVEHDTALIAQREKQDKATEALVNSLTAQLKDYQQREHEIKKAIATSTALETRKAVGDVLNYYHSQLTEGVAGEVQRANAQLENTVVIATSKVKELSKLSSDMKGTFDNNFNRLKIFSETFEEQNEKLAGDVKGTLINVRKEAREGAEHYTTELSDKFAKALSWKIASILGVICLSILAATLLLAWLLIPSKAEIAERKAEYNKLAAAKIAHNVIKNPTDNQFYARIKPNSCFQGTDNYQYCKFR